MWNWDLRMAANPRTVRELFALWELHLQFSYRIEVSFMPIALTLGAPDPFHESLPHQWWKTSVELENDLIWGNLLLITPGETLMNSSHRITLRHGRSVPHARRRVFHILWIISHTQKSTNCSKIFIGKWLLVSILQVIF